MIKTPVNKLERVSVSCFEDLLWFPYCCVLVEGHSLQQIHLFEPQSLNLTLLFVDGREPVASLPIVFVYVYAE